MDAALTIRTIRPEQTHHMRHVLLRPTQNLADMAYEGDEAAAHFGAFVSDELVGIASIYPGSDGSWRLRAMAVASHLRTQGVGAALLQACIDFSRDCGACELWCNARTPAVGFYASAGFEVEGPEFDVPHAGPHFVMRLTYG